MPILWVTYWTFRIMVGCGILMLLLLGAGLWLMRRRRLEHSTVVPARLGCSAIALPFLANATGWIFTEMGRQPWVVYGLLKTRQAVSHIGTGYVVTTLIGFTAIYSLLAVIDFGLMARYRPSATGTTPTNRRRARARARSTTTGRRPSSTERRRIR